jgi:superfamily I DNA/RNA helicase
MTKGTTAHVPIALALDEAQNIYGQRTAGLATLGIKDIENENLSSIHRSTQSIVKLAFFVIQRSTDLFDADFPDFTGIANHMEPDSHPLAGKPKFVRPDENTPKLAAFVAAVAQKLRESNLRQIAILCHAEQYWDSLLTELKKTKLELHVLLQRGEKLPTHQPIVVLARPAHAGGQEFDAVILVGLEQGVIPPKVIGNDALSVAVEQQALREMYLAITRARYRVIIALSPGTSPNSILQDASKSGLIS